MNTFWAYRTGVPYSSLKARDIEFLWDPLNDPAPTLQLTHTLTNFAAALVDSFGANPFRVPISDINLIYSYFKRAAYGLPYTLDPEDSTAMVVGDNNKTIGYNPSDRSHVDVYLTYPGRYPVDGHYPSNAISGAEDLSTGHSIADPRPGNSIEIDAPTGALRIDETGNGWTAPNTVWNARFDHEFKHSLPGSTEYGLMGEMMSAAAEAVGGDQSLELHDEFPYTWSLFGLTGPGAPTATFLRTQSTNYQARSAFTAYLAYNFRGTDTSSTMTAFQDDLLYKWSSGAPSAYSLRDLLSNANCSTCATKAYFQDLDTLTRFGLLLQNWRVANFVNNSFVAEHQFGYPPQFGFSPSRQVGAWRNLDGAQTDDVIALPSEVTLTRRNLGRDTVLRDVRYLGSGSFPMVLTPYGSEYWIIKSDAAIQAANQTLVVRVIPDSAEIQRVNTLFCDVTSNNSWEDGRIFASLVGYGAQTDSLWKHPEWVTRTPPVQWCDLDTLGAATLQLELPSFGDTTKAALLVLSLADGPRQAFIGSAGGGTDYREFAKYRVSLGVRSGSFLSPNPVTIAGESSIQETDPAFSPDGSMLAYTESSTGPSQIYLRNADGSGRALLRANSISPGQSHPDWSPRGDWVAYEDFQAGWPYPDVHLCNVATHEHRVLTAALDGADSEPSFSPNGQSVAYVSHLADSHQELDSAWVIRRTDLLGSQSVTLVVSGASRPLHNPRWSPDGQWLYFLAGDTLYAARADGPLAGSVVSRASALSNATEFDLHRGHGDIAFEQQIVPAFMAICRNRDFTYDTTIVNTAKFRVVALRDTFQRLPLVQFRTRGADYFSPRWSFDGSKIAYVTNEPTLGSRRDIAIGQVTWNHPPRFVDAPRDTIIPSGCFFGATFTASDPDGEALTYEAAYLPLGAELSSNGVFTWSSPAKTPGDNYLVFRVLDGSGGLDQRVVRYTVAADAIRPAATLDETPSMGKTSATITWTDVGDDSLVGNACGVSLRYSTQPFTESDFFTSGFEVQNVDAPGPPGTVHCVSINPGTLASCTWYYFALKTIDDAGNWSALSNVASGKTKCGGFAEVSCYEGGGALMAQSGGGGTGGGWSIENGVLGQAVADSIRSDLHHLRRDSSGGHGSVRLSRRGSTSISLDVVRLSFADHAEDQRLFLAGATPLAGALDGVSQVFDGSGGNVTTTLATGSDVVTAPANATWDVQLGSGLTGSQALYIEAAGGTTIAPIVFDKEISPGVWQTVAALIPRWTFDPLVVQLGDATHVRFTFGNETTVRRVARVAIAASVQTQPLTLTSAIHSKFGNVTVAVADDGNGEVLVRPGEHMVMTFSEPALGDHQLRDYFLESRGRRVNGNGSSSLRDARSPEPGRPLTFALHQAEPTPFSRSTRIRFELPAPAWVHLEVFDLSGRRVATLADELLPAGEHAREWAGLGGSGSRVSPGVYLYRIRAGEHVDQRKLVLTP